MKLSQEKRSILNCLILGIVLYFLFVFLDVVLYPDFLGELIQIRIVVILWLTFCIYMLFHATSKELTLLAISYLLPAATGASLMCVTVGEGFASIHFIGVLLVIVGAAAFARIKTLAYCLLLILILSQHLLMQLQIPFELKDFLINIFFLGSGAFLSVFIHFSINRYENVLIDSQQELYLAATTDPLTNLYNRRKIIELIEYETARSQRSLKPYVLVVADIDNFKEINDTYGHDIGDAVLVELSLQMKTILRGQDSIGRWGGEEFMILLPDTSLDTGQVAIERLRSKISDHKIEVPNCSAVITLTFGIACSEQNKDIDELIKLADDALYKGKGSGKDSVIKAGVDT